MPKDRRHWDAIAQAFAVDERQRVIDAALLSAEQRILLGLEMGAVVVDDTVADVERQESVIAKMQLHARWREIERAHAKKP